MEETVESPDNKTAHEKRYSDLGERPTCTMASARVMSREGGVGGEEHGGKEMGRSCAQHSRQKLENAL